MSHRCSHCGDVVSTEEWHPVATVYDEDDDIQIHYFCTDACRSAWERERES